MGNTIKKIIGFIFQYICSILSCIYVFSVGLLFGKSRELIVKIYRLFSLESLFAPRGIIPEIKLREIIQGEGHVIELYEEMAADGDISTVELIAMSKLVRYYAPKNIFEIGTFGGRTTLNMAVNCNPEAKIYTMDLPKRLLHSTKLPLAHGDRSYVAKERSGAKFSGTVYEKKIVQIYADSAAFDFTGFFNSIDFVFVDGSHSYGYALNDSKTAVKLLKDKNGVIIWHDYNSWSGVTRALNELYLSGGEFKGMRRIAGTSLVWIHRNCPV
jgi:predicted O-methyltransferase YrrM